MTYVAHFVHDIGLVNIICRSVGRTDGQPDGRTVGRADGRSGGRADRQTFGRADSGRSVGRTIGA